MPVNQVANISVPDARMIVIQPGKRCLLRLKTIQTSDLGLNPQNDGNLIRLSIPPFREERRRDLFKNCKKRQRKQSCIRTQGDLMKRKKTEKDKETPGFNQIRLDEIQKHG